MRKFSGEDIIEFFKAGGTFIGKLALEAYGESLNDAGEEAFSEAIGIGIENTIATLYEAKVKDTEIVRVVNKYWGICLEEAEDRLVWEKQQATIRSLRQYLKLQGYSRFDIDDFMRDNRASVKIRHEKDLWKLKDTPDKLLEAIKENNK